MRKRERERLFCLFYTKLRTYFTQNEPQENIEQEQQEFGHVLVSRPKGYPYNYNTLIYVPPPPLAYPLLGPLAWLPFWGSATLPTGDWSRIIFHFTTPNTPRRRRSEARTKVQHSWLVKCCNMWHNTSFNSEIPFIYFLYFFSLLRNTSRRACAMFFPLFMFPFYILFGLYC